MFTVDLRSDTVTRPSDAMKKAMIESPVGDDVLGDDPTVKRLESLMAERFGMDGSSFLCLWNPSKPDCAHVTPKPG